MKRALLGWVFASVALSAHSQQVQVFSDGKPVALADAANATRVRAHDERSARLPLSGLAEAQKIAVAHAAAFVRCGLNETNYPPEHQITPEERDYFVNNASYVPIKGSNKIILIGEFSRGKAIIDLDKIAVLTPQCPAGVRSVFWSHDTDRIVFATQQVEAIDFHGDTRALWTGKFGEPQDVWYSDSAHPAFRKLMSLPGERVLDVMLPDGADHVFILSQSEKNDWRGAGKILQALSGTPARQMAIRLLKVDLQGKTLDSTTVATGVAAGSAQFVRQ